ncbi:hypothetical protein ACFFX0_30415 [Citricoccus parietis]|uniref:Uncharacterized protein n=1 Tax=Citricoccus parietis TaxID=592307 RepID=A0ABV5G8J8_9MICC
MAVEVERARQGQAQLRLILSPLRQFLIAGVDGAPNAVMGVQVSLWTTGRGTASCPSASPCLR